ncbi:acyltransferase family protein [Legionella fairfieldensis]|uniref:acyltransferase family protein n=1 Tax=Legionella fairfieldensis TaxID=45064 RepID=UPI00068902B4|nr:acyltransferase [Legionella fairfieldensis]
MDISKRILFLDWLRIFSFSSVLIGHKFYDLLYTISQNDFIHESLRLIIKLLLPFCFGGGAGVVVFFLISGYVITHVLQKEQPLEFFIKRIFRIYPLYIVAVLLQYWFMHLPVTPHILIPQLLLLGDFFDTPHTLSGVEWTLRIEVLFYIFMLCLRHLKIIGQYDYTLPWIIMGTTLLLGYISPLPRETLANHGYVNIYAPFLFIGVFVWLYEYKKINLTFIGAFSCLVLLQHWHLIDTYQPDWRHANFAILGTLLFFAFWLLREHLIYNRVIFYVSKLTYSVYLFHCLLFDVMKRWLDWSGLLHYHNPIILALLFAICALLVKFIEQPGIKAGYHVLQYIITLKYSRRPKKIAVSDLL